MKKKTAAILSSCAAIAISASLIAGSTYALFTSESKVNIAVNSGKVNVTAEINDSALTTYSAEWNDGKNDYDYPQTEVQGTFTNGGTAEISEGELVLTHITPGDEVTFQITVTNNSNVTIKYLLDVSSDGDLKDALAFTFTESGNEIATGSWATWNLDDATIKTIDVKVSLPISVEDNYQDNSANIAFTVKAVQGNAYTEDYTAVKSEQEFLEAVEEGGTVVLTDNIELNGTLSINQPVTIIGDDNTTISGEPIWFNTGDVTVKGVHFNNGTTGNQSSIYLTDKTATGNVVIDGCTFENAKWDSIQLTSPNLSSVSITNCTFKNTEPGYRYIHLEIRDAQGSYATTDAKLTLTGNTFENVSTTYCSDSAITIAGFSFENMTIENNIVKGEGADNLTTDIIWISKGIDFNSLLQFTDTQFKYQA